jgi:glycosyltransferase involved in cell wall biosynthesis
MSPPSRKVVLLGMMSKMPVPGVVWQTVHYLLGLRALGFDPYYVEAHGRVPSMLMERDTDDAGARAGAFISKVMRGYDLGDRWAYHALHDAGHPCHGLGERRLREVYRDAELIINLHGGTEPRPEHYETGRLVYVQTDPVQLQIELHDGVRASHEFLEPHAAFFTFAENLGLPGCTLPVSPDFAFRPTRQPVVCDLWAGVQAAERAAYTTIGNWSQPWRLVELGGQTYSWSKDREWPRFLDLPQRTGRSFELALSSYPPRVREQLEARGWAVRHALDFADDADAYRAYIASSRGEFTVAKEQNVHFATGWFSDRSATYLAAGRPVVTQDTGFGCVLPTGEGLFGVRDLDEAAAAIETIEADYPRHRAAAADIAREYFEAKKVLGDLLGEMGVGIDKPSRTSQPTGAPNMPTNDVLKTPGTDAPPQPRRRLTKDSRVLALIPHFECEEWLDDALASLTRQTRPVDAIVVIDDASVRPPVDIVARHPEVTLLHADRNVGPYRLVQQVIEETDYDAYLFQDADDWSAADRLERLLETAEQTGAELIGTQEIRVFCEEPEVAAIQWPVDVNALFAEKPTAFPLLHPTSIISRDLVMELGGFASGLRFSGDAELLRRAQHIAKVVNVTGHCYFRRIRRNSLTTAQATGLQSPERKRVMEMLWDRARANADRATAGEPLDLSPAVTAPPVGLRRLTGPELSRPGVPAPPRRPAPAPAVAPAKPGPPRPIFVIGADRSGASILACALAQHPAIPAAANTTWLGELATQLPETFARTIGSEEPGRRAERLTLERFCRTFGRASAALVGDKLDRWVDCDPAHTANVPVLARMFPEARFVHVVRDADAAIRSLVDPPLGSAASTGGTQIPVHLRSRVGEHQATQRWMDAVLASVEAETLLGDQRVLRVSYSDLLAEPDAVIRRCLDWVGEPFAPECLWPLRDIREGARPADASEVVPVSDVQAGLRAAARALSSRIVGGEAVAELSGALPKRDAAEVATQAEPAADIRTGRIVMVTDHFPKFSETFFVNKFLALRNRGWDVHVVCNRSNKEQWDFFGDLRDNEDLASRLHPTKDVEATVVELEPALLHFGYGTLALGHMHLGQLTGARIVVSFRGYDVNYYGLEDPTCYDEVWESADMLHFVGRDTWARAQRRGCPPDRPHALITDAVDVSLFDPPLRGTEPAGAAQRPLRIVSVGRLHWKKGHEFGLRAVRDLLDRGVDVNYRIIGDGPHLEATLFAIHDLGLQDHVELMGARPAGEVRETLAWADVFLHPAVSEGFCVSAIEAQAMALPVVCSDADGLGENVVDGETGFVVTRRDAHALSERLAQLAEDGELRHRLGRSARLRAVSSFDAAVQVERFDRLYQELLKRPEPHTSPGLVDDTTRATALAGLKAELGLAESRAARLKREVFGREVVGHVHEFAAAELPRDAEVLIVSRGDEALVKLPSGRGRHFPQAPEGHYAGHHPADSADAVEHLEDLRARGAAFLVVPATSAWWLTYYGDFTEHLDRRYSRVAERDDGYVVFSLAAKDPEAMPVGAGQEAGPA